MNDKGYWKKEKDTFLTNIRDFSSCLSLKQFWDYKNNEMSKKEQYKVKKHLAGCDLCNLALQGLEDYTEEEFRTTLKRFHQKIESMNSPPLLNI